MINWNSIDGGTDWKESDVNREYNILVWEILSQLEGMESNPYWDTASGKNLPTIGVGFNFDSKNEDIQNALLDAMGVQSDNSNGVDYRFEILSAISLLAPSSSFDSLNIIMDAAYSVGGANRDSFRLEEAEMKAIFQQVMESGNYEGKVDNLLTSGKIPASRERAVLLSLAYNQVDGDKRLLGEGLKEALNNGDRAEAWFEIRYRSNGGDSKAAAKRRYVESQIFGLFHSVDDNVVPSEEDALLAFRMYTKHENRLMSMR